MFMLMNLVLNAAEAVDDRPGAITVATGVQSVSEADDYLWQVTGEPLPAGDYVSLTVSDDGPGMDVE